MAQQKWIWLVSMRTQVWSLASLSGWRIWCCLERWCRPTVTAPIRPVALEPPYAVSAALKKWKQTKKKNNRTLSHNRHTGKCWDWFDIIPKEQMESITAKINSFWADLIKLSWYLGAKECSYAMLLVLSRNKELHFFFVWKHSKFPVNTLSSGILVSNVSVYVR